MDTETHEIPDVRVQALAARNRALSEQRGEGHERRSGGPRQADADRLHVEDPDDVPPAWNGTATSEPTMRVPGDVVSKLVAVADDLDRPRPYSPTHDAVLELDTVSHLGIAVLGDEPEAVVLESVEAREQRALERRAEARECILDHTAPPTPLEPALGDAAGTAQLPFGEPGARHGLGERRSAPRSSRPVAVSPATTNPRRRRQGPRPP